uniref:Uncharacterized protein n=1 Tax=Rhizophora mucronata TaxID=61149 RepID=A0A2P2NHA2_RHIMU
MDHVNCMEISSHYISSQSKRFHAMKNEDALKGIDCFYFILVGFVSSCWGP